MTPSTGFALKTKYTIACAEWKSAAGSLTYRILMKSVATDGKASYQLLQYGPEKISTLLLSRGDSNNNNLLILNVQVADLNGVSTMFELSVQVDISVLSSLIHTRDCFSLHSRYTSIKG